MTPRAEATAARSGCISAHRIDVAFGGAETTPRPMRSDTCSRLIVKDGRASARRGTERPVSATTNCSTRQLRAAATSMSNTRLRRRAPVTRRAGSTTPSNMACTLVALALLR